jgi:hypothetical protein
MPNAGIRVVRYLMARKKKTAGEKELPVGYTTVGITLPLRTSRTDINRKRWNEFAAEVQKTLNEMRESRCEAIAPMVFEGQGVLITSFRPPQPKPEGTKPDIGIKVVPLSAAPKSIQAAAMNVSLNGMLDRVERHIAASNKPEKEAVDEAVEGLFGSMPAEGMRNFIDFAETHCKECGEERYAKLLSMVLEAVKAKLNVQLC